MLRYTHLYYDIDGFLHQRQNIGPLQPSSRLRFLDQQHELFEGQITASRMNACDRTRVTGVDVSQVIKGFFSPQLSQQYPVGTHA